MCIWYLLVYCVHYSPTFQWKNTKKNPHIFLYGRWNGKMSCSCGARYLINLSWRLLAVKAAAANVPTIQYIIYGEPTATVLPREITCFMIWYMTCLVAFFPCTTSTTTPSLEWLVTKAVALFFSDFIFD